MDGRLQLCRAPFRGECYVRSGHKTAVLDRDPVDDSLFGLHIFGLIYQLIYGHIVLGLHLRLPLIPDLIEGHVLKLIGLLIL